MDCYTEARYYGLRWAIYAPIAGKLLSCTWELRHCGENGATYAPTLLGNTVLETKEQLSRHLHREPSLFKRLGSVVVAETCHFSVDETIPSPTDSATTELGVARIAKMDTVADTCRGQDIGLYS